MYFFFHFPAELFYYIIVFCYSASNYFLLEENFSLYLVRDIYSSDTQKPSPRPQSDGRYVT